MTSTTPESSSHTIACSLFCSFQKQFTSAIPAVYKSAVACTFVAPIKLDEHEIAGLQQQVVLAGVRGSRVQEQLQQKHRRRHYRQSHPVQSCLWVSIKDLPLAQTTAVTIRQYNINTSGND